MDLPGWDGFLGTRGSLMLDVVCLGMVLVLATLAWSIRLVRVEKKYALHKKVQIILTGLLLVVLTLFEVDIRLHGWEERAAGQVGGTPENVVYYVLWVHLFFAVTTLVLWLVVFVRALKNFPRPPLPAEHSNSHRRWAWLAAIDMLLTTLTGWAFYVVAFVL